MSIIVEKWMDAELPLVSGVYERSGRSHLVRPVDPPRLLPLTLEVVEEGGVLQPRTSRWTQAIPMAQARDSLVGDFVIVGECGHGSDGFVAVQKNEEPESLIWLAFFDFSNPFESMQIEPDVIRVFNNLQEEWCFDRSLPWRILVRQQTSPT